MSKKNYTKYSENTEEKEIKNEEVENEEIKISDEQPEEIKNQNEEELENNDEIKNEEKNKEENSEVIVSAVVANCKKLNVRDAADKDANVICVVAEGTELTVDVDNSTEEFYKVYTQAGEILVEGYCMKNFISLK